MKISFDSNSGLKVQESLFDLIPNAELNLETLKNDADAKPSQEEIEEEFSPKQPEANIENDTDGQETPQNGFSRGLEEHTAPTTILPIPQHQEGTEKLLRAINERIRPQSFRHWFKDKIAISYEDEQAMTIRCLNIYTADWLTEHYSNLVEGIVKKNVAFHGKEIYDAKEDQDRHRKLEC